MLEILEHLPYCRQIYYCGKRIKKNIEFFAISEYFLLPLNIGHKFIAMKYGTQVYILPLIWDSSFFFAIKYILHINVLIKYDCTS